MKNQYSNLGIFENIYLVGAFLLGTFLQVIVVVIPKISEVFKTVPLNKEQWLFTIAISFSPIIIMEVQKKFEEMKFGKTFYKEIEKVKKGKSEESKKQLDIGL